MTNANFSPDKLLCLLHNMEAGGPPKEQKRFTFATDLLRLVGNHAHLQGVAGFGNYLYVTTGTNLPAVTTGFLYIVDCTDPDNPICRNRINTPTPHPGGMQVAGNYLIVGSESKKPRKLVIQVYDLSIDTQLGRSALIGQKTFPDMVGGAVALTPTGPNSWCMLIVDDKGYLTFYTSEHPVPDPNFFTYSVTYTQARSYKNAIALVSSLPHPGRLYFIGLRSNRETVPIKDYYDVYEVDLVPFNPDSALKKLFTNRISTKSSWWTGPHCRWGAGISIPDSADYLMLYLMSRGRTPGIGRTITWRVTYDQYPILPLFWGPGDA